MKQEQRKAKAKINLSLDVKGRREDGYHLVTMVMQTIDLWDDVTVSVGPGKGIFLDPGLSYLPADRRNIAWKAAETFLEKAGISGSRIDIRVIKRIPVAAGLAGGSADGAAVLLALQQLFGAPLTAEALFDAALSLGADVPYCMRGGTMLAQGIGEVLSPLPPMPPCFVVLCKPPFAVSTPEVYRRLDKRRITRRPDTRGLCGALKAGDYNGVVHRLYNVLEDVTAGMHDEVESIKSALLDLQADGAVMSGSGPSVFGLFRDETRARLAYERLASRYADTFLTQISNGLE